MAAVTAKGEQAGDRLPIDSGKSPGPGTATKIVRAVLFRTRGLGMGQPVPAR
jgi:hypothetical protein